MDDNISMFGTHIDIIKGSGVTLLKYNAMSLQLNWAKSIMLWDLSRSVKSKVKILKSTVLLFYDL